MDDARINRLVKLLSDSYALAPVFAAELECYVQILDIADDWWRPLHDKWRSENIPLLRIEKERGVHQFELVLGLDSAQATAAHLLQLKRDILAHAEHSGAEVYFDVKPFADQPASGVHLHVHLQNADDANVFVKDADALSEPLQYSLGGLLYFMPLALDYYCPNDEDKIRFDDADHVPRANCWGANNRYCALRIPPTLEIYDKWIELRVPSSNVDAAAAIAAMLSSLLVGLENRLSPGAQEHGKPAPIFLQQLAEQAISDEMRAAFLSHMQANF
jgi:glutamine synthetase